MIDTSRPQGGSATGAYVVARWRAYAEHLEVEIMSLKRRMEELKAQRNDEK